MAEVVLRSWIRALSRRAASKPELVAKIGVRGDFNFDVSPDGKELICSVGADTHTDLMLIRRFR